MDSSHIQDVFYLKKIYIIYISLHVYYYSYVITGILDSLLDSVVNKTNEFAVILSAYLRLKVNFL